MVSSRTNRIARSLIQATNRIGTRVLAWYLSVKLNNIEWQQILESDILTFRRPATKFWDDLERRDQRLLKLTGPNGGAVEAMITDLDWYESEEYENGEYEITVQMMSREVGSKQYDLPPLPDLEPGEFEMYRTEIKAVPYVVIWRMRDSKYHSWNPLSMYYNLVGLDEKGMRTNDKY
jgi:hypothetical protein